VLQLRGGDVQGINSARSGDWEARIRVLVDESRPGPNVAYLTRDSTFWKRYGPQRAVKFEKATWKLPWRACCTSYLSLTVEGVVGLPK